MNVQSSGDQEQGQAEAARALWEDLARRARGVHCPDHYVEPWRVTVLGDTPRTYRLYISGCCGRLGDAVNQMVRRDPRIAGPR